MTQIEYEEQIAAQQRLIERLRTTLNKALNEIARYEEERRLKVDFQTKP